jgi:hypothetical protein
MGLTHYTEDLLSKTNITKWTEEEMVNAIIDELDQLRIDMHGGYPSQFVIENGKVYWATITDEIEPNLTIEPIKEFIAERMWLLDEIIEELKEKTGGNI